MTDNTKPDYATALANLQRFCTRHKPCPDCDRKVKNRTIDLKLIAQPVRHWRKTCTECRWLQDPSTGKYSIKPGDYYAVYAQTRELRKIQDAPCECACCKAKITS